MVANILDQLDLTLALGWRTHMQALISTLQECLRRDDEDRIHYWMEELAIKVNEVQEKSDGRTDKFVYYFKEDLKDCYSMWITRTNDIRENVFYVIHSCSKLKLF